MIDDNELDSAVEYAFRFGEIAIAKGFITAEQLEEALDEQITNDLSNNHHKLIGELLLEQRVDDISANSDSFRKTHKEQKAAFYRYMT